VLQFLYHYKCCSKLHPLLKGLAVSDSSVPRILLIVASVRSARFADRLTPWLEAQLSGNENLELDVLDLRDHPLPLYDLPKSPASTPRQYRDDTERSIGEQLDAADGFLILTPEYNHGYPGALKNALDHFFAEFAHKPVAFVGYGSVGASRAIEQLRQVMVELEAVSTRHALHIVGTQMREIMGGATDVLDTMNERLDMVVANLLWWTTALRDVRSLATVPA
jgi:NAD(P)H-dependent FMN reductase